MEIANKLFSRLWKHIGTRRRTQIIFLCLLMVSASTAEIASIGLVLPFIGVLLDPNKVTNSVISEWFFSLLRIDGKSDVIFYVTFLFCAAVTLAGIIRFVFMCASTRLAFAIGSDLGSSIYQRTLYQPYATHLERNTSQVIDSVSIKANVIVGTIILPSLTICSSLVMMAMAFVALMLISPATAFCIVGCFALVYFVIYRSFRGRLILSGQRVANESVQVIKILQEGLGGIRDIILDGTQETFNTLFRRADHELRRAQGDRQIIGQSPRYVVETIAIVAMAIIAYGFSRSGDEISSVIPALGAFALGAQRFMPIVQQVYSSWSSIKGGQASLRDVLVLLDQPLPSSCNIRATEPLVFKDKIKMSAVSFRYKSSECFVLNGVDLTIKKGSRVGIIGKTGSGKSTLVDILMGLLEPTFGVLTVDDHCISGAELGKVGSKDPCSVSKWRANIAHVPQTIFLSDSTIAENIAFGIPSHLINVERVHLAAHQAQLAETIEGWPLGYQTQVGERGVRLSGGQRQRLGIARALYRQAEVIIFDEATSALDHETEKAVMGAIENLSTELTIIIIAHRLSTLQNCSQIIELKSGKVSRIASYSDIADIAGEFQKSASADISRSFYA